MTVKGVCLPGVWIIILLDSNRDKRKRDKLKIAVSPAGLLYYKHLSDPDKVYPRIEYMVLLLKA